MVEAFESMTAAECTQWQTQFSTTQKLLRDDGSVASTLSMAHYDVIVMDRKLKITYRGGPGTNGAVQQAVTAQLSTLK